MSADVIPIRRDNSGRRRTPFAVAPALSVDWPAVAAVQAQRAADRWPVLPDNIEVVTTADGALTVRPIRPAVAIPADAPSPIAWEAPRHRTWLRRALRALRWL